MHERLFHDSIDPIVIEDLDGRIVDVNDAAAAAYGWSREELIGQSYGVLVPYGLREEEAAQRRRCAAGTPARRFESARLGKDGAVRPVMLSLSVLRDAAGAPAAIAAVATWVESGPMALLRSGLDARDAALRVFAEATPAGVFDADLCERRVYWSPEMLQLLGLPMDAHGRFGQDDVPDHVHPADRERVHAAIRKSHDPSGDGRFETEHRIVRADGEVRWLLVKGRTMFEGGPGERRPVRAVGIALDITTRKQAEEARLKALIDVSSSVAWACDADGRFEDSPSWRSVTGQTAEEWKAGGWPGVVHPQEQEEARQAWAAALRDCMPFDGEWRVRHVSAEWRYMRIRAIPLLNDDDSVRGWVGIAEDVTDRKRAELEAARASEREREANALLDAIFAAAPIGLGFWDRDLRFQRINERLAEMHGLPVDAHAGRRLDELLPAIEGTEELYLKWREILASGEPWLGVEVRGETPARPGQQRTWKEDFFPVRVRGEIVGLAAVVQEITERRLAEAQLRESEARFRQMADNAPFMVWVTAPDGACTFLSRSWYEFTGLTPASGLGVGWLDAVHPDDREWSERAFREAQERLDAFRIEFRLRRHDGEYRWVLQAAAPRFSPGSKFKGYIGSIIDITERKQAEQALESADRMKDEFIAALAHELRNPLAPLTTATELLGHRLPRDPSLDALRSMIERQLNHLTRLVDDLLDTSRITSGRIVLRRKCVDLREVIRHSVETSQALIAERGHALETVEPDEQVAVDGDPIRLAQIVTNLLNNAAKFTPPGGRIELELAQDGRDAIVTVRDNGIGIAAESLPRLFDRFMRIDEPREDGGLGLGLSLVKRLAELHGGSVDVQSEGLGKGAAFVVRLPLAGGTAEAEKAEPRGADQGHAPRRVLVVDDNEDAAASLVLLLRHFGHDVRAANDAGGALELAQSFCPDVVLLDIGLPDMDGWELARALRARSSRPDLKLIAVSGYGQNADRRRSLDAGIDRHLTKPVDYAEIARCL